MTRFLILFFILYINLHNLFAGINYSDYFDNQKYSDEYSNSNKIFISISAGCAVRLFNDPLLNVYEEHKDDFESRGYEKTDIMTVFMVDAGAQRLFWNVYDTDREVLSFDAYLFNGENRDIESVVCNSSGDLYMSDLYNHCIYKFKVALKDGNLKPEYIKTIGILGGEPGQFNQPVQIALDEEGNLYVADCGNSRIQKLDKEGNFIFQISGVDDNDKISFPIGVSIGLNGDIYISDTDKKEYYVLKFSTCWRNG